MKDYATAPCCQCHKEFERDYRAPQAQYCSRDCYHKSRIGKVVKPYKPRSAVKNKRICHGIHCRSKRMFVATGGYRICPRCRKAIEDLSSMSYVCHVNIRDTQQI